MAFPPETPAAYSTMPVAFVILSVPGLIIYAGGLVLMMVSCGGIAAELVFAPGTERDAGPR